MMSAAMSTMYDTDMLEPLVMGNWTLKTEVSEERRTKKSRGSTGENCARGNSEKKVTAPNKMTAMMYHRARGGRSRNKTPVV